MTVWVLVIACYQSFFCSQGPTWQHDKVYASKAECEMEGVLRARKGEIALCLEGTLFTSD